MNHYQDITLKPNSDINLFLLRNKVYDKLHKTLYDLKSDNIGVSFPNITKENTSTNNEDSPSLGIIQYKLGNAIRLHSEQNRLEDLQKSNWLNTLSDYCEIHPIKPIPQEIQGYQIYSRKKQTKSNAKLRRAIKRNQLNEQQIQQYKADWYKQGLKYPFVELNSVSTNQRYRIFIQPSEIHSQATQGNFNHFGLSSTATVPIF
jgi:CRISPR-associated endonuclease Csy4